MSTDKIDPNKNRTEVPAKDGQRNIFPKLWSPERISARQ
jgi:hypothetical protein